MAANMLFFLIDIIVLVSSIDEACDRRTSKQQDDKKEYININDMNSYSNIYTPAEIGDLEFIWIGYPRYHYKSGYNPTDTVINMIREVCYAQNGHNNIVSTKIIVQIDEDLHSDAINKLSELQLIDCVEFKIAIRDDIWIRDIGPVFAYYNQQLVTIDFDFDFWSGSDQAGSQYIEMEESLDRLIYYDDSSVSTIINTCLIGEGGNREFNGNGLLMMNQNVEELRNLDRSIYGIKQWTLTNSEMEYKKLFNINKIIWLKGIMSNDEIISNPSYGPCTECIAFGWGTGGHIDEIARFVDENTIAILKITEEDIELDEFSNGQLEEDKELMDDNIAYLTNNFEELSIVEIPLAPTFWVQLNENDDVYYWYEGLPEFEELIAQSKTIYGYAATSYLNFVITNQAVLVPKYYVENDQYLGYEWIKKKDEYVSDIMKNIFSESGREIIQINPININIGGGGMHCITAHQPSKISSKHYHRHYHRHHPLPQ